jgi:hypothetical protein
MMLQTYTVKHTNAFLYQQNKIRKIVCGYKDISISITLNKNCLELSRSKSSLRKAIAQGGIIDKLFIDRLDNGRLQVRAGGNQGMRRPFMASGR